MDNEDVGGAGRDAGDINEVDVVLSESHDGAVVASIRSDLDVIPTEGRAVSSGQRTHFEVE